MAEPAGNNDKSSETAVSKVVSDFVNGMSEEHRMLVVLKAQLYGGTWEPMLDDLQNRLRTGRGIEDRELSEIRIILLL